jgi:pimeloyl-ACP methyl ester carboxylesterase
MGAYFRVIAFDPRGFGSSPAPASRIDMATMVSDIADLIRALALPRAHVFGVSMGGILALRFASENPSLVSKLVLVSTPGSMTRWSRKVLDLFEIMVRRLPPQEFVAMMAALSLSPPTVSEGAWRVRDLENALVPRASEMAAIRAQVEAVRSLGTAPLPESIEVPTLILAGRRDFLTPPEQAEELHRALSGSELHWLAGGHACLMENTDEGIVRILAFLQGGPSQTENEV